MRRQLGLIVLLASSTFANFLGDFLDKYRETTDIRPGIVVRGGTDLLYIGDDLPHTKASTSYGYGGGLSLSYPLNESFSVVGEALYLSDVVAYKVDSVDNVPYANHTVTIKSNRIGLQFAPVYKFNPRFGIKLGYQYEIPLNGTVKTAYPDTAYPDTTITLDLKSAPQQEAKNLDADGNDKQAPVLATHNLLIGATYSAFTWLTVAAEAKIGLHSSSADYNAKGLLRGHTRAEVVHQFGLSIKTALP
ncbi:MAG: outer membrane beta-barrel protein [Fibrobacteres bacterium]|nr:outer membrane beta-barrel protein [Fibrobacterota bacterium]